MALSLVCSALFENGIAPASNSAENRHRLLARLIEWKHAAQRGATTYTLAAILHDPRAAAGGQDHQPKTGQRSIPVDRAVLVIAGGRYDTSDRALLSPRPSLIDRAAHVG